MKGHTENGKFHPHKPYKGVRKSRDQKVKTKGVKIRKGRWDDSNFIVMKVKNERIGSKEFTDEAKQNLSEREYFETKNLGEAIRAVDEGRGNIIMDKNTENIMSSSLKKRDAFR